MVPVASLFAQVLSLGISRDITTYFSFFGFRPGFFGTKSRPMVALTCSTKLRSPSPYL